jgi:RNA recognition motif-containing protein
MLLRRAVRAMLVVDTSCQRTVAMSSSSGHVQQGAGGKKGTGGVTNRVYVGNLPYKITARAVRDHMMYAGQVLRIDFIRNSSGQRVGCGIVEFATASAAKEAIKLLHETRLGDRVINVREDREAENLAIQPGSFSLRQSTPTDVEDAPSLSTAGASSLSSRRDVANASSPVSNRICIENLETRAKWITLQNHFKPAGTVTNVEVDSEKKGKLPKHFVEFATPQEAAKAAKQLNYSVLNGRKIEVYVVAPVPPRDR